MSDLRELYQTTILDHNKKPRNFCKPEAANREARGWNPLCGDKLTVYLTVDDEDVVQEVPVYALNHIARYDPQRASFTTWLHVIAVSRCRDRQRRWRLSTLPLAAWLQHGDCLPDTAPGPEHQVVAEETRSEVWEAIQTLSHPLREAILLRHWGGHTFREMSEIIRVWLKIVGRVVSGGAAGPPAVAGCTCT